MDTRIAIAVMCFDRPHYLKEVIQSFEEAEGCENFDWYFFQDGVISEVSGHLYADVEGHKEVTKMIRETNLPVKSFVRQLYNVGPGQQRFNIYRVLNDHELMFVFDDDMIIGRDYLTLLTKMAYQFPEYVGLLYTNSTRKITRNRLQMVREEKIARLWGHYMWKHNWEKFRDDHYVYYEYIKQFDFHEIRKLHREGKVKRPPHITSLSDDVVVNVLCRKYGINKLVPYISRARYIGKKGIITYKTDDLWNKRNMVNQRETITFDSDKDLEKFVLR